MDGNHHFSASLAQTDHPELMTERGWAQKWLFGAALPLWWLVGADHECGGFYDRIDHTGSPVDLPKRIRVQARQAFVYAEAGRLGWDGPWSAAVSHAIDFMLHTYRRPDGLFGALATRTGRMLVKEADLYDQGFVLLALASAYRALGCPARLLAEAEVLLDALEAHLSHRERGFEHSLARTLPLGSNPQMHLLEAMLAWVTAGGGARFVRHAEAIVALACERLIDPITGAIGEHYDAGWAFANDGVASIREPGHQYEWAVLLREAQILLGVGEDAAPARLVAFATRHGIRDARVIFSVAADGTVVDGSSRLWAQTERLRAALLLPDCMEPPIAEAAALQSLAALKRYLDVPIPGLWRDRIDADDRIVDEAAPASSFYHILTGLAPLLVKGETVA